MHAHLARNAVTGRYWDGRAFAAGLSSAVELSPAQLAVVRASYENVQVVPVMTTEQLLDKARIMELEAMLFITSAALAAAVRQRDYAQAILEGYEQREYETEH